MIHKVDRFILITTLFHSEKQVSLFVNLHTKWNLIDPLFTLEMYSVFVEMSKIEDSMKRLNTLKQLVQELPGKLWTFVRLALFWSKHFEYLTLHLQFWLYAHLQCFTIGYCVQLTVLITINFPETFAKMNIQKFQKFRCISVPYFLVDRGSRLITQ